jgi:putative Holliday junction resolvase
MTFRARQFGRQLTGRFGLPVHLVDERLTTREAKTRLRGESRAHEDADSMAAQVILEDWLSEQGACGSDPA